MNAITAVTDTTPNPRPRTAEELLDQEEARALQRMTHSVQRLGDDLCAATAARERIRRHPLAAVGLGAVIGFVVGPPALGACKALLGSTSMAANPDSKRSRRLPGVSLDTLRFLRTGR